MAIFTEVQYINLVEIDGTTTENASIMCKKNGQKTAVPLNNRNADYVEIMQQVVARTITIADAKEDGEIFEID